MNVDKCRKVSESVNMLNTYPGIIPIDSDTVDKFIDTNLRHTGTQPRKQTPDTRLCVQGSSQNLPDNISHSITSNVTPARQHSITSNATTARQHTSTVNNNNHLVDTSPKTFHNRHHRPLSTIDFNVQRASVNVSTPLVRNSKGKQLVGQPRQHCKYPLRRGVQKPARYGIDG